MIGVQLGQSVQLIIMKGFEVLIWLHLFQNGHRRNCFNTATNSFGIRTGALEQAIFACRTSQEGRRTS